MSWDHGVTGLAREWVTQVLSDSMHSQQLRTPAEAHVITAQTNGLL